MSSVKTLATRTVGDGSVIGSSPRRWHTSWTIAVQAFHPFWIDRVPYTIGTVELVEQPGLMFASQIVDCEEEDLCAGLPLEVVFERLTPDLVVPFFRPAQADGGDTR